MYEQNAVSSTLDANSQQPQEIQTNTLTTLQPQAASSHQVIQQSAVHDQINDISSLVNGLDVQIQPTLMEHIHSFRTAGMCTTRARAMLEMTDRHLSNQIYRIHHCNYSNEFLYLFSFQQPMTTIYFEPH